MDINQYKVVIEIKVNVYIDVIYFFKDMCMYSINNCNSFNIIKIIIISLDL